MEALAALGASALEEVMASYRDVLAAHQERINRLNVYPVPDGDTGTNMALTVQSIVAEIDELPDTASDVASVCKAINHGSLMGARGNSGVILSQLLRGWTGQLVTSDQAVGDVPPGHVGPGQVAAALVAAGASAR